MGLVTVGIDLSLTHTGLVAWDGNEVLDSLLIVSSTKDGTREERIRRIARLGARFVRTYQPALVGIENYAFAAKGALVTLAEVGGVVKQRLSRRGVPFAMVAINSAKAEAGHGRYSKKQMVAAANRHFPCDDEHLADAFWIAHYAATHYDDLVEQQPTSPPAGV